jgi:hypothetical protein
MQLLDTARAYAGRGLDGDRYAAGAGTFSPRGDRRPGYDLTLIAAEVLDELAAAGHTLDFAAPDATSSHEASTSTLSSATPFASARSSAEAVAYANLAYTSTASAGQGSFGHSSIAAASASTYSPMVRYDSERRSTPHDPAASKGKRARIVPLIPEVRPLIERRLALAAARPDGRLFVGPRGGRVSTAILRDATHWDDVVASLGFDRLRRHDLRHTGLT